MRHALRKFSIGAGRPNTGWLMLFLLLTVLVPSACLVWFMGVAVRNEQAAVRQQLMDACRENLASARNRADAFWSNAARDLLRNNVSAPALFAIASRAGIADGVVILDASSQVAYPASAPVAESGDSSAARLLQEHVRDLMEADKKADAISLVTNSLAVPRFARAVDAQGRLIVPNAELLVLEVRGDIGGLADRLCSELLNYNNPMPATQRRFLMRRIAQLFPRGPVFPTFPAEELAAEYLELKSASILTVKAGNMLLLYRAANLPSRMQELLGTNVALLPPGTDPGRYLLTVSAGTNLPGWQLAPAVNDRNLFETAADAQTASYIWVGILALATVVVLAVISARLIRRQAAVAQLRNDLVANVTHELKTPLSSMRLLVDTLLNSPVLNEKTVREYLQLIASENLRLSRLIDNFLAFSRMERNKQAFDFSETAPKAIIDTAAAAVRERFNTPDCSFQTEVAADLPPIRADAGAMVTALLNLLDNACKYSGEHKEIKLRATAENGHVDFAVADNGIGVPPREIKRIFKRFYQVDQRLARTGGGCGLGLSIVQFIVTAHHGTIRVESQPGRGSTFTIGIPVAAKETTA
ncbi:MAG TPA: HAMP domain-containing sensor histidine kinase [Verrucomicrobiae bacterium]|nr:HAMP domain-containing sensor histidine kinase [Verrucomicrobiae bacterium]